MDDIPQESEDTSPLTWIALAIAIVSIVYAPLLFATSSSSLLIKLGLIRKVPIAAGLVLIYGCGAASLERRSRGKTSRSVIAIIVLSSFGMIADLLCLYLTLSPGGSGP